MNLCCVLLPAADFLRVGALRRIDGRLLGNSLHCCGAGPSRSDAAAELADMLKAATSPAEAAVLRAELAQARSHLSNVACSLIVDNIVLYFVPTYIDITSYHACWQQTMTTDPNNMLAYVADQLLFPAGYSCGADYNGKLPSSLTHWAPGRSRRALQKLDSRSWARPLWWA